MELRHRLISTTHPSLLSDISMVTPGLSILGHVSLGEAKLWRTQSITQHWRLKKLAHAMILGNLQNWPMVVAPSMCTLPPTNQYVTLSNIG